MSKSDWISVTERLPQAGVRVLIVGFEGHAPWYSVAVYHPQATNKYEVWEPVGLDSHEEFVTIPYPWVPTHWMPLEPPEEST